MLPRIRRSKTRRAINPRPANRLRPPSILKPLLHLFDSAMHRRAGNQDTPRRLIPDSLVAESRVRHDTQAERLGILRVKGGSVFSFRFDDLGAPVASGVFGRREKRVGFAAQVLNPKRVHDTVRVFVAETSDGVEGVSRSAGAGVLQCWRTALVRVRPTHAGRVGWHRHAAWGDGRDGGNTLDVTRFLHGIVLGALQYQQVHRYRQTGDIVLLQCAASFIWFDQRLRQHHVVIEQQRVGIKPRESVPTHALQITTMNQLSS